MAELAFIGSVIQVADVGIRLSLSLYAFRETVASADRSIITISKDVSLTASVLKELGQAFKEDKEGIHSNDAVKTAEGIVQECSSVFRTMDEMLVRRVPNLQFGVTDKISRAKLMLERVRWPTIKGKIELLNANLDRMKSTLILMLNVIIYARQALPERNDQRNSQADMQVQVIEGLALANEEKNSEYEALQRASEQLAPPQLLSDPALYAGLATIAPPVQTQEEPIKASRDEEAGRKISDDSATNSRGVFAEKEHEAQTSEKDEAAVEGYTAERSTAVNPVGEGPNFGSGKKQQSTQKNTGAERSMRGASIAMYEAVNTPKQETCSVKGPMLETSFEDQLTTELQELMRLRSNLIRHIYSHERRYAIEPETELRFVDGITAAYRAEEKRYKEETSPKESEYSYSSSYSSTKASSKTSSPIRNKRKKSARVPSFLATVLSKARIPVVALIESTTRYARRRKRRAFMPSSRRETMIVEELRRHHKPPSADNIIEVNEEHSPPRRSRRRTRSSAVMLDDRPQIRRVRRTESLEKIDDTTPSPAHVPTVAELLSAWTTVPVV